MRAHGGGCGSGRPREVDRLYRDNLQRPTRASTPGMRNSPINGQQQLSDEPPIGRKAKRYRPAISMLRSRT
jgi:hypothetical protein